MRRLSLLAALAATLASPAALRAQSGGPTTVSVAGGAAPAMQVLPPWQTQFGLRVPLRTNAENTVTVTASDTHGDTATSAPFTIVQLSLGQIVTAQVTATRLTIPEIKQLVADGTINVSDPANFNVSRFDIVLTINGRQVPVSVPVMKPVGDPGPGIGPPITIGCAQPGHGLETTDRAISIPCGGGGGGNPSQPPVVVIPFTFDVPDQPSIPPIPGVIVIEGRIKTLKEFYKVNLILTNVSTLFTLTDIEAMLEVPAGALTPIVPASGPIMIPDLPPGSQQTGTFIVRGDQIGVHTVTAHFGAKITGLGLPGPIPVSGSASTDVEVKGPPRMDVTVSHPDFVQGGVPYTLTVQITNTDPELPALFTSFELDVGVDARLVDPVTGQVLMSADVRALGDILPGESVTQSYTVLPFKTGPITSCTAGASQNLKLSVVFTGFGGGPDCAIGTFPSETQDPSGRPSVVVIPTHNTTDVTIDPAVTAIFSAPMIAETITTGFTAATFNLLDPLGDIVPCTLEIAAFGSGNTIAILRPVDVLQPGALYTIQVRPEIFDMNGLALASGLTARFTTKAVPPPPNASPPQAGILVLPPVTPGAVPLGQMVPVRVDATDDVAVTRVDLLLDGGFVDTQTPHSPVMFMLDTAGVTPGPHTLRAVAFDAQSNSGSAETTINVVGDTVPPSAAIVTRAQIQRGRTLPVRVDAADNGTVARVEVFLDGGTSPVFIGLMAPFQFGLATSGLGAGPHGLHAVATDGAGNTTPTDAGFTVIDDLAAPVIVFQSPVPGAEVTRGKFLPVAAVVTDDVGLQDVGYFLDDDVAPRTTDPGGFILDTGPLAIGPHTAGVIAHDLAGNQATAHVDFSVVTVPVDTTPPAAPDAGRITVTPPVAGLATVGGSAGAVEAKAQVEIANLAKQVVVTTPAGANGSFQKETEAAGGDTLRLVAIDAAGNRSPATDIMVPVPPALISIDVTPPAITLNRTTPAQQLTVTGHFSDASQATLASGVAFTSENPTIAAPTATGLVLPGKNGSTTLHVTVTGVLPVDVPVMVAFPTVVGVHVSPPSVHLLDLGKTQGLSVVADLSDNTTAPFGGSVAFGSQDATIATVDTAGVVTGVGEGSTTVVVAPNGFATIPVPVTVEKAHLVSIFTDPASLTFVATGQMQSLAVSGNFSDASQRPVAGATFMTSNAAVATVDTAGVVTSGGNGNAMIHVAVAGAPPIDVPVHVKTLVSIALDPSDFQLIGTGKQRQLGVVGTFSDASMGAITSGVGFQSNHTNVATVSGNGLVTSTGLGDAIITATFAGVPPADSTVHVVARAADDLSVSPPSLDFTAAGQMTGLVVSFHFNDGTTGPPDAPVTFASNNMAIVTVDAAGKATAVANGDTSIHVASGVLEANVPVSVNIPVANPPPHIDEVDRPRAAEGDPVVIRGSNFAGLPADNTVTVNGVAASVTAARQDELVFTVPVGATTGPVQVSAHSQTSNQVTLTVYARRAQTQQVTPALAMPSAPLILNMPAFPFRAGDRVFLSSAPDVLAPLAFTGTLSAKVDNGSSFPIPHSAQASEITSAFSPGSHTLQLRLDDAGGGISTAAIYLVFGPDGTGAIAGEHSEVAQDQSRPIVVTFTNLLDLSNTPLPEGSVVAVSTLGGCTHRDRSNSCIDSAGGSITNGAQSPNLGAGDLRIRNFVVMGGRVDVVFDPAGIQLDVAATAISNVTLLPTNPDGTVLGQQAFAVTPISLLSFDTATAPRSQSSVIADGRSKVVTINVSGLRDASGNPIPDGALVAASTLGGCAQRNREGTCINSAGGNVVNGSQSPNLGAGDLRIRVFQVTGGMIQVQYDPASLTVSVGTSQTATVSLLAARGDGFIIGNHAFATVPIVLSSPFAEQAHVTVMPSSALADSADNRVTIVVTGIVDQNGNPAPDGTKISVSTLGGCGFRDQIGTCVDSAGGVIMNGAQSPDVGMGDGRIKVLTVTGGQVEATYSALGVALATPQSATARVTFRPATPSGAGIGSRAFVIGDVALGAYDSSSAIASPPSAIADNLAKTVAIAAAGIRDVNGNLVPDGAVVAASTLGGCGFRDHDGNCISSAGGIITNGTQSPDVGAGDRRIRLFTVTSGQITVHYDPQGVTLPAGSVDTANVSLLPARPGVGQGNIIGGRAFTVVPVALTSAATDPAHVSVVPPSLLADGAANLSTLTVSAITDGQGRPAPNHTRVAVSTLGGCFHRDLMGNCIFSAEGTVVGGSAFPNLGAGDNRVRVFDVLSQQIQAVYSDAGIRLSTGQTTTARLSVLPANGADDTIIGGRAFAVGDVMLVSYGSADITGSGTVAASAQSTYSVSNILDLLGNPVPDGSRIAVSTLGSCFHRDTNGVCISSSEGTIVDGTQSPELASGDFRIKTFTVGSGGFSFTFQAPASGQTVLQLLPADPTGLRNGGVVFTLKTVDITP